MTLEQQPPEQSDGGYWYPVEAVLDGSTSGGELGKHPGVIEGGSGWCVWYATINTVVYGAVRTPDPVTGISTTDAVTVTEILEARGNVDKPYGRVGGE